jgi:hypothetical protein
MIELSITLAIISIGISSFALGFSVSNLIHLKDDFKIIAGDLSNDEE